MHNWNNEYEPSPEEFDEMLKKMQELREQCLASLRGDGESDFMSNIPNEDIPILQEACRITGYDVDILPLAFGEGKIGIIEGLSAVYRKDKVNHLPLWEEYKKLVDGK